MWVSDFFLMISPSQLPSLPFVGMLFTASELWTFLLWLAPHSFLLAICWCALHSEWVLNFSLMTSPSQLFFLFFVGMLFTASEFLTFPLQLAPHSFPSCPLLACSSQQVSFQLFPYDQPLTAPLLALCWLALHSEWVSDFFLGISPL